MSVNSCEGCNWEEKLEGFPCGRCIDYNFFTSPLVGGFWKEQNSDLTAKLDASRHEVQRFMNLCADAAEAVFPQNCLCADAKSCGECFSKSVERKCQVGKYITALLEASENGLPEPANG